MFRVIGSPHAIRIGFVLATLFAAPLILSGCLVAGVSSGGGFFIWPGSLGLLIVIALLFFFLRRGR